MSAEATTVTPEYSISISLHRFQSLLPISSDSCQETLPVSLFIKILGQSLEFTECDLDLGKKDSGQLETCCNLTWQSSTRNSDLLHLDILETLVNDDAKLTLQNNTSNQVVAVGACDFAGLLRGENPLSQDIELILISENNDAKECVAIASLEFGFQLASDGNQEQPKYTPLLSEEEAKETTVLALEDCRLSPVSERLKSIMETDELSICLGLSIASNSDLNRTDVLRIALLEGLLKDGEVEWTSREKRILLVTKFKEAIESDEEFIIEIWRQLSGEAQKSYTDPAFDYYNAIASCNCASLLTPGATSIEAELEFNQTCKEFQNVQESYSSVVPTTAKSASNSKLKPIEEVHEIQENACFWKEANSKIKLRIKVSRSLIPPWKPPVKPSHTLRYLIPLELATDTVTNEAKSWTVFKQKVLELTADLRGQNKLGDHDTSTLEPKLKICDKHKEAVREAIEDIAKEMYGKHSLKEVEGRYNELYVHLMQLVEDASISVSNSLTQNKDSVIPRFERLAIQYEEAGELEMARRNHLDRVLEDDSFESWSDLGLFYFRIGDKAKGEESLRKSLTRNPSHVVAMTILTCFFIDQGITSHIAEFEKAKVFAHEALSQTPECVQVWEILTLLYSCEGTEEEKRNCRYKVDVLRNKADNTKSDKAFLELSKLCLKHNLVSCAEKGLTMAADCPEKIKVEVEIKIKKGEHTEALELLKTSEYENCRKLKFECLALKADANIKLGEEETAKQVYCQLMQDYPDLLSASVFLQYGRLLENLQSEEGFEHAESVFLKGLAHFPEHVFMWIELGKALINLGKLKEGELALHEATRVDPSNPESWAHLTTLYLQSGRPEESNMALSQAIAHGIKNGELLGDIAKQLIECKQYNRAQNLLSTIRQSNTFTASQLHNLEEIVSTGL